MRAGAILIVMALPIATWAEKPSYADLEQRVAQLEKENAELRSRLGETPIPKTPPPKSIEPKWNRPVIGVDILPIADAIDVFKKNNLPVPTKTGVVVVNVHAGSPAETAGLKQLDVITRLQGKAIADAVGFEEAKAGLKVGQRGLMAIRRMEKKGDRAYWRTQAINVTPVPYGDLVRAAFNVKKDDFSGHTFYTQKSMRFVPMRPHLDAYVVSPKDGEPFIRFNLQYIGKDWLFIRSFAIKSGDKAFEFEVDQRTRKTEVSRGWVFEWVDVPATDKHLVAIRTIASDGGTLRIFGRQYRRDVDLNDGTKTRLRHALELLSLLNTTNAGED